MNNFFEQFKTKGQEIRMSSAEKARVRATLFPSPVGVARPSPYYFYSYQFRMAFAALMLFVFVGSGSAYAAEGALPGDVLYPIKVSVNETVALALANTPEKKLETEARLASRRVAEAKTLDAEGRLDTATAEKIEKDFDVHATRALALADAIEPVSAAAEASVAFEEATTGEDVRVAAKIAPEATMMLSIVQDMGDVATATAATTTVTVTVESKEQDIRSSLESQKELFKELRKRAESRSRGEVQGASAEHRNDGKSEN